MLLTGFDAPRLKRLYFGRKLKDHNLLQAITRVNRPYGSNRYGYIIDFADIKKNFDETNAAYLAELNKFNDPNEVGEGNEVDILAQVMENPDELIQRMQRARQVLFDYPLDNAEEFSTEISTIEDKEILLELKKALVEVILLNIVDNRTNLAKSTADALRKNFGSVIKIYRSSIPMAVKAAEVASKGVSIYKYEPSSPVAKAYAEFAKEVSADGRKKERLHSADAR